MPFVFLKQPSTYPQKNLCAFYALHHYSNGSVKEDVFIKKVAIKIKKTLGFTKLADAEDLVKDGNDPEVLGWFGLKKSNEAGLKKEGLGVIANVSAGHFFCVREDGDKWYSYDSAKHSSAKAYDTFDALKKAEIKSSQIWT